MTEKSNFRFLFLKNICKNLLIAEANVVLNELDLLTVAQPELSYMSYGKQIKMGKSF